MHVDAGLEAGGFDGLHDEVERRFGGRKIGRETAFIADRGTEASFLERRLERVEDLRAPTDSITPRRSA